MDQQVHCTACGQTFVQSGMETCSLCRRTGTLVPADHPSAMRDLVRQKRATSGPAGEFPVSKVCPACGSGSYTTERPQKFVAFAHDRVCTACNTRYSPPTPTWAGVIFIVVGLLLGGFGGFSIVLRLVQGNLMGLPAMACEGFLGVLGVLAIVHGIRTLVSPGDA